MAARPAMRMTKLTTSARTGRLIKISVKLFISLGINRRRSELRFRRKIVIDGHRHAIAKLENSCADDRLARLQPRRYGDEVAARLADSHHLLTQSLSFLPCLGILLLLDHVNGITVRRVGDSRTGNDDGLLFFREYDFDLREHAWPQFTIGIL